MVKLKTRKLDRLRILFIIITVISVILDIISSLLRSLFITSAASTISGLFYSIFSLIIAIYFTVVGIKTLLFLKQMKSTSDKKNLRLMTICILSASVNMTIFAIAAILFPVAVSSGTALFVDTFILMLSISLLSTSKILIFHSPPPRGSKESPQKDSKDKESKDKDSMLEQQS